MEFISSNGNLIIDKKGNVNKSKSELSDWLLTIKKVDVEELNNYYKLNGLGKASDGDVLDFGYWDNEDVYHEPSKSWREETFFNQDFDQDKVNEIVSKSFEWIKKNRN